MLVLASLVALAHLADYLTFIPMVLAHGLSAEANPIVVWIAQDFGLLGLTVAKLGAVGGAIMLALSLRHVRPELTNVILLVGFVSGAAATATNLATI